MADGRKTYTIRDDGGVSTVKISEDVDSIPKKGAKSLARGVRIEVDEENKVKVDLSLTIEYGYSIPEVARDVQERVKSGIESMTGMEVTEVNISVGDVEMEDAD